LIPVLYVNQEMVLRLGTVTGVGHARLMLERSAASGGLQRDRSVPADALTIVTAFIGISLAGAYDATYTDLDGRPTRPSRAGRRTRAVAHRAARRFGRLIKRHHTMFSAKARAVPIVLVTSGFLCWPMVCAGQMVGPTPQPPSIPITAEEVEQIQPESWAVHAQSTFTTQYHPGFTSPFRGPNSLNGHEQARETFDLTLYAGVRPWPGAEFWIDPEIDQGFGLSNTTGVAGYPSGEAYKLGKSEPYFLIQRAFLRQTVDLGGGIEKLDPDLNQLAGTQTADRLVFTIGKYSIIDIFDTNKYAHDPRNDFFNWSIIDQGAFDYAANAWGYSYGATAEWYQNWWTARAGVFDLSTVPNGLNLSPGVRQGQLVTELEERHSLWDQPGKLKFLYWLTWGDLGTYLDAIALGQATGQTPSTGAVRRFRTKDGVGLNLEQQLTGDLGVFARASLSQGSVEEDAFTDINQSISAGLSLTGSSWGRADDTMGLAGVVNRISHDGKLYLAAGGIGGIIGDGQLLHAGPEQIIEAYYNFAVFRGAKLTLDYQFINNPAYNRDRGPVSILGLRAHVQF
jgi:high affinity Mn2+ porin